MKRTFVILFIASFTSIHLHGQQLPKVVEQYLEENYQNPNAEGLFVSPDISQLDECMANPLDLNKAGYDDMEECLLITPLQIEDILDHREKFGPFMYLEELQVIASLDMEDIRRIRPFIMINRTEKMRMPLAYMLLHSQRTLHMRIGRVLEKSRGYNSAKTGGSPFNGSADNLQVRFSSNYSRNLKLYMMIEKDAGERFFSKQNGGFDYITGSIFLKNDKSVIKNIVVGDLIINMGQGLITHRGFGASKSSGLAQLKKGGSPLKANTSVNENGFLRGCGITLKPFNSMEITLVGSSVKHDGRVISDTTGTGSENRIMTSLQTSGLHRTTSERLGKDAVRIHAGGGIIKWSTPNTRLALNTLYQVFDADFVSGEFAYKKFALRGNKILNLSADISARVRNFNLFGEVARSSPGGHAMLIGCLAGLDRKVRMGVILRHYERDYISLTPSAFGELPNARNESGIYWGIKIRPSRSWHLSAYADLWKHPWLRFLLDKPSRGSEYLLRVDFQTSKRIHVYASYLFEAKDKQSPLNDSKIDLSWPEERHRLRFHIENQVAPGLILRSRLESAFLFSEIATSHGMMLFQDIIFKPMAGRLSFTARFALFDSGDHSVRIYAYENGVLFDHQIPSYSKTGTRHYINIRFKPLKWLTLEGHVSRTVYSDDEPIGTGYDAIPGNVKTKVIFQAGLKF